MGYPNIETSPNIVLLFMYFVEMEEPLSTFLSVFTLSGFIVFDAIMSR